MGCYRGKEGGENDIRRCVRRRTSVEGTRATVRSRKQPLERQSGERTPRALEHREERCETGAGLQRNAEKRAAIRKGRVRQQEKQ
ncbi:hypothetical protein NDU88_001580 [Pleurodeles waltl]|uniref:Uncharacterized protein n=1 Tax=Pleurodeles waltl TaxID=8319 RepID=A0AAV7VBF5_PLEWA|nr:hypothetical protein NDU88_001580 [Pleurodeles waltl]